VGIQGCPYASLLCSPGYTLLILHAPRCVLGVGAARGGGETEPGLQPEINMGERPAWEPKSPKGVMGEGRVLRRVTPLFPCIKWIRSDRRRDFPTVYPCVRVGCAKGCSSFRPSDRWCSCAECITFLTVLCRNVHIRRVYTGCWASNLSSDLSLRCRFSAQKGGTGITPISRSQKDTGGERWFSHPLPWPPDSHFPDSFWAGNDTFPTPGTGILLTFLSKECSSLGL